MLGEPNVLGTLAPKHIHLFPAVFFQFHLKERWGMDVQTRCDISRTVEARGQLLLSANTKSYMQRRLAQWTTLSDLEWPHRALSLR